MKHLRTFIILAVTFATGGVVGFLISQYFVLGADFQRVTALGYVISTTRGDVPLTLLDLYEIEINRQDTWLNPFRLDWNDERIKINLRRYVAHLRAQQRELAEDDVVRAARLCKHGAVPNAQDLARGGRMGPGLHFSLCGVTRSSVKGEADHGEIQRSVDEGPAQATLGEEWGLVFTFHFAALRDRA